jgi:hypothetical protein
VVGYSLPCLLIRTSEHIHANNDNIIKIIGDRAHGVCDLSAEDAYSSMAPDTTFAFVGGPCCLTLDFVFALWIMITFDTQWDSNRGRKDHQIFAPPL